MEWFSLLVPVILCGIGYYFYKRQLVWWEMLAPIVMGIIIILSCKGCVNYSVVQDDEYWGSMVVEARYYEYWSTWEERTCSYTTCGSTDEKGNCTSTITHYYDCSYCDENRAYWMAYDDAGNAFPISENYYNYLVKKWADVPKFSELNRDIDTHGRCGVDGNMYYVRWHGEVNTSEAAVTIHDYTNKVQASHSAFKLPYVSDKLADTLGLYKYPDIGKPYKQKVVLGADSIFKPAEVRYIETQYQYFNGHYGKINKVKLFVCLFYDKPLSIAQKQEAYWSGGNQNELVICIGMNKATRKLDWVYPFSWTDNKRILIDCREDIMSQVYYNPLTSYTAIEKSITNNIVYKNFQKDFNYLTIDMPTWSYWLIYILMIISSVGLLAFGITNDISNETIRTIRY